MRNPEQQSIHVCASSAEKLAWPNPEAIPHAEQLYEIYLKERAEEEEGR